MSTRPARGNSVLGDVWTNCKRWTRKAVRNPSAAILELALALFALFLFSALFGDLGTLGLERSGFGDIAYVTYILPAVCIQVAMATGVSSGLGLVEDLQTGMFEKVVVTPMRWSAVFAGKAAADLLRVLGHVLVIVGVALAMGATVETGVLGVVGLLAVCLLFALWYMALSNVLAVVARDEETMDAAGNLLLFPLLFLSSGFLPVSTLPETIQTVAKLNPVTYGVEAGRALVLGRDTLTAVEVTAFGGIYDTLVPAFAVLVGMNIVVGALAVWLLGRASSASAA